MTATSRLLLVLALVGCAVPVQAQARFSWTPSVLYGAGSAADDWSTRRFLRNGSGCTEAARWIGGARPAPWKLTATTVSATAVVTLMHYAVYRAGRETGHPTFARRFNLITGAVGGGLGLRAAVQNVRACPSGGR